MIKLSLFYCTFKIINAIFLLIEIYWSFNVSSLGSEPFLILSIYDCKMIYDRRKTMLTPSYIQE